MEDELEFFGGEFGENVVIVDSHQSECGTDMMIFQHGPIVIDQRHVRSSRAVRRMRNDDASLPRLNVKIVRCTGVFVIVNDRCDEHGEKFLIGQPILEKTVR